MVSWARSEVKRETKNQGKGFKDYPIDVNLFTKVPTPPDLNQNSPTEEFLFQCYQTWKAVVLQINPPLILSNADWSIDVRRVRKLEASSASQDFSAHMTASLYRSSLDNTSVIRDTVQAVCALSILGTPSRRVPPLLGHE